MFTVHVCFPAAVNPTVSKTAFESNKHHFLQVHVFVESFASGIKCNKGKIKAMGHKPVLEQLEKLELKAREDETESHMS